MPSTFNVEKRRVAEAYHSWKKTRVKKAGVERDKFFIESIKGVLLLQGQASAVERLPSHKNTWNDWKRLDRSKTIPLTREVCLAVKAVTGVDVTPGGALGGEYNSTELAVIAAEPVARIVSNAENADGHEQYEVSCTRVAFRRSRTLRVEAKWCASEDRNLPRQHAIREIGSAIVGLRRADIQLEADGAVSPIVTLLSPDKNDPYSRAEGVQISDDPSSPGRWTVEAGYGEVLVGSVDLTRLASAKHKPNSKMQLTVEADKNDFEIDFRPLGEWPEDTEQEEARSNMRRYFIANVLRLRLSKDERAYLLSRASIKT